MDGVGPKNKRAFPLTITTTLWANGSIRVETGFLALFIAFVIKSEYTESSGFTQLLLLGVVGLAAGLGGFIGNGLGARLPLNKPETVSILSLAAVVVTTLTAVLIPGLASAAIVGLVGSTASSLAKVCLDSVIQHELPEASRASAFGLSETVLQLSWVFGGVVGLLIGGVWSFGHDSVYTIGFAVITVVLVIGLVQSWLVRSGKSLFPWLDYSRLTKHFRRARQEPGSPSDGRDAARFARSARRRRAPDDLERRLRRPNPVAARGSSPGAGLGAELSPTGGPAGYPPSQGVPPGYRPPQGPPPGFPQQPLPTAPVSAARRATADGAATRAPARPGRRETTEGHVAPVNARLRQIDGRALPRRRRWVVASTAVLACLTLAACDAPRPDVTFYGNRTAVESAPTQWCVVNAAADDVNCDQAAEEDVERLTFGRGQAVQINVPGAVGDSPWAVYFRYLDEAGALKDGRSEIFTDGLLAYTLRPFSEQDQLVYVEVRGGLVLVPGEASGVDYAFTQSWLLLIDPEEAPPAESAE